MVRKLTLHDPCNASILLLDACVHPYEYDRYIIEWHNNQVIFTEVPLD